jgi:hypothetical protein
MTDLLEELNAPDLIDSPLIPDLEESVFISSEEPDIRPLAVEKTAQELLREKIFLKRTKVRGLVLVAHPDDCLIFAHKFIRTHKNWEWDIVYLTHDIDTPRGQEVYKYWRRVEGVKVYFLNFQDNLKDLENNQASFTPAQVKDRLYKRLDLSSYKFVLTHNKSGEYGHPHHRVAHYTAHDYLSDLNHIYFHGDSIAEHDKFKGKMVFKEIVYDASPFNKEMFPLHWGVMETFDLNRSMYMIPLKTQLLLSEIKRLEKSIG